MKKLIYIRLKKPKRSSGEIVRTMSVVGSDDAIMQDMDSQYRTLGIEVLEYESIFIDGVDKTSWL